jgi:iron complex outermembrane receptor protein
MNNQHSSTIVYRKLGLLAGAAMICMPSALWAQSAPRAATTEQQAPGDSAIQEIVVTAQKRSENVQKVPIAITAFTAQALHDKHIQDVSNLGKLTPNVNLDTASAFGGANEVLSASIRGIGQDDFALNLDPGVGVYVDGVYYARTTGANVNMLDVDRVEILKGPQGTLFGRNTIGGAISVVSRTPGNDFKAVIEATGGSYDRHDFQATADIPLINDTLLSTLTFASLNRDGYQKRIAYPQTGYVSDPIGSFALPGTQTYPTQGGQGQNSIRYKLLWKASADFTATFTADWTHVRESSTATTLLKADTGSTLGGLYDGCVAGAPGFLGPGTNIVCGPRGPGLNSAGMTVANPAIQGTNRLFWGPQFITGNIDTTYSTGPNFNDMDNYGGALTLDWTLSPNLQVKSITGYRRLVWAVALDPDGSPLDINQDGQTQHQHQFSQELQLNGTALDGRLKFTSGLYYFNEGGQEHDFVQLAGGTLQIDGTDSVKTSSYAAFAHADYLLTDALKVIVGARYSSDHKSITVDQGDDNAFFSKLYGCYPLTPAVLASPQCTAAPTGLPGGGFPVPGNPELFTPAVPYSQTFNVFTPTAGLQYQINPSAMAYATYSKGYKDGGWTTRLTNFEQVLPAFGPEKSQTFEGGVKTEWLNRTLQLNLTGFYTDYNGIQLNFQEGLSPTIQNAGNAHIYGFEFEGRWNIVHGLSLSATAGYMHARYAYLEAGLNGSNTCVQPDSPCITTASQLPKTPKWKNSVSPVYDLDLGHDAKLRFAADYTHTSSMFNDSFNTSLLFRPATDNLNLSVTFVAPGDRYELTAGGTNVTNQRYLVTGNEDTASGLDYGTYNAPAEWYVTVRAKF